jgi:hypothetical protein
VAIRVGKVIDMQSKTSVEPSGSAVPGVIPEPPYVHHDGDRGDGRHSATLAANDTTGPVLSSNRRNPARRMLAKLVGALRGDKYMANAYPPERHSAANTGPLRQSDNGNVPTPVEPVVEPDPGPAHDTAPAGSPIKDR